MTFPIVAISPADFFPQLSELPQPPKELFVRGSLDALKHKKILAIVGSRRCSSYGKEVCNALIEGLSGYPIVVVSGLALGIDATAHEAALKHNIPTIAFPGSGLEWNVLYPAQHRELAERILSNGGALISEYPHNQRAALWTFPKRNRLMAGLADMVIVIEAEEASGTLITARLATEYNKRVGVVPGSIYSPSSKGVHQLLKLGATPITSAQDIIEELGITQHDQPAASAIVLNEKEEQLLQALSQPLTRDELIDQMHIDPVELTIILSTLELKGAIKEALGRIERIK